jgi:predicted nucleic acid-binding protein
MEHPHYLMDTNAVIDYLGEKLPLANMIFMNGVIDAVPNISIITKIEVLGFNAQDKHYQLLTNFINDALILELTSDIANICIEIRKKHKTKLPDAIIAATALAYDYVLISRNISDFKNIENLQVINPHNLRF